MSGFLADLEKGRRGAALLLSKMPHVIPHSERVVLFRKHIADEKAVMGLTESACNSPPTTLIVVHRSGSCCHVLRNVLILSGSSLI